jgi:PTH1 family peptidyl-tRNA hydrolase
VRLLVGLGNPGKRYRDTPHNAGFQVCDRFAEAHRFPPEEKKFQGLFRRGRAHGEDLGVLKPQTYMNRSGECVAEALRYLPVSREELIVVYDEIDLSAGRLRVRPAGGHGGHNGLRSVIEHLGGFQGFPRVRVGVGRPAERRDPTGHLLSRVRAEERERFEATVRIAVEALDVLLTLGVAEAMNRYNGLPALAGEASADPLP